MLLCLDNHLVRIASSKEGSIGSYFPILFFNFIVVQNSSEVRTLKNDFSFFLSGFIPSKHPPAPMYVQWVAYDSRIRSYQMGYIILACAKMGLWESNTNVVLSAARQSCEILHTRWQKSSVNQY